MPLEEFLTKVHLLIDDSGYQEAVKGETLRDTLVFGLKSDKVRGDTIAKCFNKCMSLSSLMKVQGYR